MRSGRAQTALEFMMSNSLVIVLIILLVMALVYLGSINTESSPHSCFFQGIFACRAYSLYADDASIAFELQQLSGKAMLVTAVSCTSSAEPNFQALASPVTLQNGIYGRISGGPSGNTISCSPQPARRGELFRGNLCVEYREADSPAPRTICGILLTPAE